MAPFFVFLLFLYTLLVLPLSAGYGNGNHKCPPSFYCGSLGWIHYPFTKAEEQHCGLIGVHGCDNSTSGKTIELKNGRSFLVSSILRQDNLNRSFQITIFDQGLHDHLKSNDSCEAFNNNITIPANSPLVSFDIKYNITLYRCNHNLSVSPPTGFVKHPCPRYNIYHYSLLSTLNHTQVSSFSACSVLLLPKKDLPDTEDFSSFLTGQITLDVRLSDDCDKCYNHEGGQCQIDTNEKFKCDKAPAPLPPPAEHKSNKIKLAMGLGLVCAAAVVGALIIVVYCFRRKLFSHRITGSWKNKSKAHQDFEAFLRSHGSLAVRRYSYSEIKKMTNSFKEKLGQGGYGTVFKGKLHENCPVAVKVLNETKGNGEEFINEVASISRTSHVNIVTLLGFCFEGSKKALVYEFMANGSLEKFIYENKNNPLELDLQLSCETLCQIAAGVGRGLEYLHRGWNTRILHFDIKPHNILLDENFFPKISDFGLAKICPKDESIVSMMVARGTIGYIAPEVISRNFGEVSHKSDVYSFGMMALEMVGGRRNVNVEVDHTSEIYFPHWIYRRLELNEEHALRSIRNEGDKERMRQMVIISLWCIQTNPSNRPMMSKVVEMLEGRVETLQIPPKPYLSSPSRSPCPSSSTY